MDSIPVQVVVGVLTALLSATAFWVHRRYLKPLAALPKLQADVAKIKAEVQTNGGSSLKDGVNAIRDELAMVDARQRGVLSRASGATFETDSLFNWTDANLAMERLTGVGFARLERLRWISRIHDDDRARVMEEISYAVKDKRAATTSFRFITDAGDTNVHLEATPVFSRSKPNDVLCWSGIMTPVFDRRQEERRT